MEFKNNYSLNYLIKNIYFFLGSRATSIFRFGFIALDLISLIMNDAGEYVCRVTSATGCVESRAILQIRQRESIEKTSQHPDSLQYIQQLEDYSR